jgi:tRNA pseudouridine65 synthase
MELSEIIIHEDEELLVMNKPSGLLVHRGWGRDAVTLVDLVRQYLGADTAYPAQRLDRGTSGVIVFARSSQTASALGEAVEKGLVAKDYLVLVRGRPPENGVIDHPIPRKQGGPRVPATTSFRTLHTAAAEPRTVSWIKASILCGRLHQVRRHLKHINHPVIGDADYGKGAINRAIADRYGLCRLALHAARVTLPHPRTGDPMQLTAPVPEDLRAPLEKIGIPATLLAQI